MKKVCAIIILLWAKTIVPGVISYNASASLSQIISQSTIPVVIKFFLSSCGPCQKIKPLVEKLSEEFAGRILFIEIDMQKYYHIANSYEVRSVPTLLYFKNGQLVGRHKGYSDINILFQEIQHYLLS